MNRYALTQGLNSIVQGQQFNDPGYVYPVGHRQPDEVYDDTLSLEIGGERIELFHGRGETDDATFVWLSDRRILASGDFVIWMFPNAGNPRKVQRTRRNGRLPCGTWNGWSRRSSSRTWPGHFRQGPCRAGAARRCAVLEHLVREFLALMNRGATLDQVLHAVTAPAEYLSKPICAPSTMIRSSWSGDLSPLCRLVRWQSGASEPARAADLALELARLAGGADRLAERAAVLAEEGNTRLAAHLAEFASEAAPDDKSIQAARALVLRKCIDREGSLMGKAFLAVYEREAAQRSTA